MDAATYWRLRYLQAASEGAALRAALAEGQYRDALRAVGIDPATPYAWQDASTSVVPVNDGTEGRVGDAVGWPGAETDGART